jgi:acyl-CoA synthetase (AMP-forming)/AMP-acid ligase II
MIRILNCDPDTLNTLPEGCIGEIWVTGSSVAQGYWMRPELTRRTFQACLLNDDTTRYLRTGDLGYLRNGELYVSGRLKDLIIMNGKKYAPQDIEHEAERSHCALRQAGGAAFGVSEGTVERLVIVFELKREWVRRHLEWPSIISAIHLSISATHGVPVNDVVLIKPGRSGPGGSAPWTMPEDYFSRGGWSRHCPKTSQVYWRNIGCRMQQQMDSVSYVNSYCDNRVVKARFPGVEIYD